jgi:hypothetical protein
MFVQLKPIFMEMAGRRRCLLSVRCPKNVPTRGAHARPTHGGRALIPRAEAVRFQELANKTSPAKAPEVRTSRGATTRDYTVAGYTGSRLSAVALGSSGQPTDPVPVDPNHHFLPKLGIYAPRVGEFFRCRASFAEVILVEAITNLSEKHLVSRVGSRVGD